MSLPRIIQGGMGIGVSNWKLAREVSLSGQLGVVSGTGINTVLIRRLQDGDKDGKVREAMRAFPVQDIAERVLQDYYVPGGKALQTPYKRCAMFTLEPSLYLQQINALASFVEVTLAKEGHDGIVGINLLEKIQMPNPSAIYGAMLAGVDYVLMGAGIPREIPRLLDELALQRDASIGVSLSGAAEAAEKDARIYFSPNQVMLGQTKSELKRPRFIAIISSNTLAVHLAKKASGRVDGFVVEGPSAGGHNAPPRGSAQFNDRGEPVYGPKDAVDLDKLRELGLPFWLAGAYGRVEKLQEALALGAEGVQIGTAFAFCEESGLSSKIKSDTIQKILNGSDNSLLVHTDAKGSPTGFPFKVVQLEDTLASPQHYLARPRKCDLGYLRQAHAQADGSLVYRCPAEPVEAYIKKGGSLEETQGKRCLCNGLMADIDLAQKQERGYLELPLVTAGDDLSCIKQFLRSDAPSYSARNVIERILDQSDAMSDSAEPHTKRQRTPLAGESRQQESARSAAVSAPQA